MPEKLQRIKGPGGPFDPATEVALRTPVGEYAVTENAGSNAAGTSYVRILDSLGEDGAELAYWTDVEWCQAPGEVMGAIFGAIMKEKGITSDDQVVHTRAVVEVDGGLVS